RDAGGALVAAPGRLRAGGDQGPADLPRRAARRALRDRRLGRPRDVAGRGETMLVTLAAGQRPLFTLDPRETIATMTSFIVQAATGDQPAGSLASRSLYAVAATLFAITLLLNLVSQL